MLALFFLVIVNLNGGSTAPVEGLKKAQLQASRTKRALGYCQQNRNDSRCLGVFYDLTKIVPLASDVNMELEKSLADCEAFQDAVPTTPHGTNMTWTCEAVEQGVQTLPAAVFQLRRNVGMGYWWHRCDCTYIKYRMLYLKNDPVVGWIAAKKMVNIGAQCKPKTKYVSWHKCRSNFMLHRTETTRSA